MLLLCFLFLKEWPMLNACTQYHNTIMNLKFYFLIERGFRVDVFLK